MKLDDHFDVLLQDTVNLARYRLDQLDQRVQSIYDALVDDDVLGQYVQKKTPQGSWAHRTIINPVKNTEFDADFLLHMEENSEWSDSPKTYIQEIYAALGRSGTYKSMPRHRKCRCVRIVYANIVPYLILADGRKVIVNRDEDTWEDTNPEGFTAWMRDKDDIANGNLRRVIRLLKFLRDHKGTFTGTRSVILTTLVGERISATKKLIDPGYYNSIPTVLMHIMNDLDEWLQARPSKPSVPDPSGSGVNFDHRWTETTYQNFRDRIHSYAEKVQAAYDEPDKDTSVKLWQEVFGDGFHAPPKREASGRFGVPAVVTPNRSGRAG